MEKDVKGYLSDLCDTFNLTNLINQKTCLQSEKGSSLDVILTNRPRSFQTTSVIETVISDHHKLTTTFLGSIFGDFLHKILSIETVNILMKIFFYATSTMHQ